MCLSLRKFLLSSPRVGIPGLQWNFVNSILNFLITLCCFWSPTTRAPQPSPLHPQFHGEHLSGCGMLPHCSWISMSLVIVVVEHHFLCSLWLFHRLLCPSGSCHYIFPGPDGIMASTLVCSTAGISCIPPGVINRVWCYREARRWTSDLSGKGCTW